MSTHGILGVVVNGLCKYHYVNKEADPGVLGLRTLAWVRDTCGRPGGEAEARNAAHAIRVVNEDVPPTAEEQERLAAYFRKNAWWPPWHQLLAGCQGSLRAVFASGVILDAGTFPADSWHCAWGYLVNFDERALEVYAGRQTTPHDEGWFASLPPVDVDFAQEPHGGDLGAEAVYPTLGTATYYPIRPIASFPFDALPTDEAFSAAFVSLVAPPG